MNEQRSYAIDNDKRISNIVWRNWNTLANIIGAVCTIGIWFIAITIIDVHQDIGIYLILCGIAMAFLELSLVVDWLFSVCCSEEFAVRQCWSFVLATDTWKRGLLYLGLSAVCYIKATSGWQVPFAGALMDLASIVYFIKTIKGKQKPQPYRYKQLSVT
ncbi:uncharacterized protein LOC114530944 [Dendronephthya gigantea]|uniref:uncharacterized protein LOC114530944 n=1 Tax=Dendronephthya gigantea TaxID=151771 RepID=UPI00106C0C4D|nr:uncharacterized protein LOC114530944 [Dendronephthya gigantea]